MMIMDNDNDAPAHIPYLEFSDEKQKTIPYNVI